jgi:hypothetical protein
MLTSPTRVPKQSYMVPKALRSPFNVNSARTEELCEGCVGPAANFDGGNGRGPSWILTTKTSPGVTGVVPACSLGSISLEIECMRSAQRLARTGFASTPRKVDRPGFDRFDRVDRPFDRVDPAWFDPTGPSGRRSIAGRSVDRHAQPVAQCGFQGGFISHIGGALSSLVESTLTL